jgi:hypothetical protein
MIYILSPKHSALWRDGDGWDASRIIHDLLEAVAAQPCQDPVVVQLDSGEVVPELSEREEGR